MLKIDYSNALYVGLTLKVIWKLQQLQNVTARLVSGISRYKNVSLVLACLHQLPVGFPAKFMVLMLTYKALNALGPCWSTSP